MNPDQQLKKYKFIPWIFAIFFCVFIIVDIAYIIIAEKTWRGLSTEDGYQKTTTITMMNTARVMTILVTTLINLWSWLL